MTTRLAQEIVQMAETRAEVVRKEIATEFVDYYIEFLQDDAGTGSRTWGLRQDSIFVLTADGFKAKKSWTIIAEVAGKAKGKGRFGKGRFLSRAHVLNTMAFYGYDPSAATFVASDSIMMRLRVPRKLLEAHPEVLS
ncbi:ankrd29 [Symbiodinium microadriaticum]|nr:ankrd29 [Symbiodinium microadriaticum]